MPLDVAQHELNEKGMFQPGSFEADLISIIQQVPAAIAIVKGSTFIIEVANPQTLEVWGKTWEEVAGRPVFEVFPELLGQGFDKILSRVFQTGVRFVASEARVDLVRHGRPETLYVNFSYDPYRDREGKVIGIISTGTDVTELVKAKQALTESNERLRLAMETVEMGTWDYNPATGTILCSELTQELFGFFAGDPITLDRVLEAVVETDRPRVMAAIQKALTPESGGHYNVEYSLINYYDQKLRTIRAKGQVFFQQGVAHRFIGTALDITPEIKAREEQQKLRSLVDNSLELMSVLELDGRNSYLNKAGMELLGFDSFEPVPALLSDKGLEHRVLGAQANVWTEYMAYPSKVEYMIFPRMTALSEVLWSPREIKDIDDFRRRLKQAAVPRYQYWQSSYFRNFLEPDETKATSR